jgi:hypothetical protein
MSEVSGVGTVIAVIAALVGGFVQSPRDRLAVDIRMAWWMVRVGECDG